LTCLARVRIIWRQATLGPRASSRGADELAARRQWPREDLREMRRKKERPVRGDNRTGQAIWALGVDGRSRRIQLMGRDFRSHIYLSLPGRCSFKANGDFFGAASWVEAEYRRFEVGATWIPQGARTSEGRRYCAAGRIASSAADLSDTMARTTGTSLPSDAFSGLEGSGPPAVGTDGPAPTASTAANASASPAPN
jgi:hypothetical protein